MLVFVVSDKGGTGRSVTSSNVAYRSALRGSPTCYVDFDFGSPTAGSIFNIANAENGVTKDGVHSYLDGRSAEAMRINVWERSERSSLRGKPPGAQQLVLVPGDHGGSEFAHAEVIVDRCKRLFDRLEEEFELSIIDLSAGRSYATELVLQATAGDAFSSRWLVFHRWTRQHLLAAANLVYESGGILKTGKRHGHEAAELQRRLKFVRTAVIEFDDPTMNGLTSAQASFLNACNKDLTELANRLDIGPTRLLGQVPLEPLLQWREQLISNNDVNRGIANKRTVKAIENIADALFDEEAWRIV